MLTARPLKSGTQFKSFGNTTSGWGSGQSLDQYLAGKLAPPTTFKSLQLGVHVRDTEVRARISYAARRQPIPPREDPKDVFAALFGTTTGGTPGRPIRRWRGCGRSARACSTRPTPRPTRHQEPRRRERPDKLDAHLTAMRDVEKRLVGMTGTGRCRGGLHLHASRRCPPTSI